MLVHVYILCAVQQNTTQSACLLTTLNLHVCTCTVCIHTHGDMIIGIFMLIHIKSILPSANPTTTTTHATIRAHSSGTTADSCTFTYYPYNYIYQIYF